MILTQNLPDKQPCAFCSSDAILEEQDYQGICNMLVYYCHNCKQGFTTTESDTISVYRIQSAQRKRKRRISRKEKINNILNV